MRLPKKFKSSVDEEKKTGTTLFLLFLVRHGEKFIATGIVIAAIWLAVQARNFQPLPWQPKELETLTENTENTISKSIFTIAPEKPFDYATYAEQIKEQIPTVPYRTESEWKPVIQPGLQPRSGFEVLPVELLRGEAVRRTAAFNVSNTSGTSPDQWKRPPISSAQPAGNHSAIWINLYGTIPHWTQWDIFNQDSNNAPDTNKPEYVFYELQKAEIKPKEELVWQPVIVYPDHPDDEVQKNLTLHFHPDFLPDRLVPFEQDVPLEKFANDSLLFSDFDIEPARTYMYRIRLYLVNPNYSLQETSVKEGVDTKNRLVQSDWSDFAKVYVPDRTLVQLHSVIPTDQFEFPRQSAPLRPVGGTLILDYFDIELGQSLPSVEKTGVLRGMLGNMSKNEANRIINRGRSGDEVVNIGFPDTGLRSDVCVLDFSGGRKLQKRGSREAQGSPDLSISGRALLLMPDGTMRVISTEAELLW